MSFEKTFASRVLKNDFRVEKLSRFDDLEFLKAETFAKMTEKREM